jgi:septum formation protein
MTAPEPPRLLLASTSRYRRALLERLRLPFDCIAPAIEETQQAGETPESMACRLAEAKARAVAVHHPGALVLGSDQAASLAGRVLGKPGSRERAHAQLAACSGLDVVFHTAVCLIDPHGDARGALDTTRVRFRVLDDAAIGRYLEAESPFDCAGSFKAEAYGITLFERIDSEDPTALIGLPLIRTATLLREAGLQLP